MKRTSFKIHCSIAFAIRLVLIAYSNFHDKNFAVPYTDVDYKVFTDAARYVTEGKSPFDRHTYRYTPLLALFLVPNIFLHADFGKLLFSVVDILVAVLMKEIVSNQKCNRKTAHFCAFLWLYNPLTIVISTRGNADALAVFFVLSVLYSLQKENCVLAGILHGLSVHLRLYPLAFSLAMYLSLRGTNYVIPNKNQVKLVFSCLLSLFFLTTVSYYFYGYKFLFESFIYHLIRKDARHNFSVYFYMLYLSANEAPSVWQRLLTLLPQFILLLILSLRYSSRKNLPFAMLTQAMVMVTYNPVMTSQYFFWFLSLLPACLPHLQMSASRSIVLTSAWFLGQGLWLLAAYLLEFRGFNSFSYIWFAGLLFFAVNVKVLIDVIASYKPCSVGKGNMKR